MHGLKVLLVEDDENLSYLLRQLLEFKGYETATAKDGAEGVLIYRLFKPDLVISDLELPGENGVIAVRRMRSADNRQVRTIFMSGNLAQFSNELEREKVRPEVTLLAKPFSNRDLLNLVAVDRNGDESWRE
jgi:CheY-like chemotaxis protein